MDLHPKQFVRINVRIIKSEDTERIVDRNFCVDPRTITLDRLRHLVARALDVRGEFSVLLLRGEGVETLPLTCDWDLEGALFEEPRIDLALELHPKEPGLEEWDIICPADVPVAGHEACSTPSYKKGSFLEQILQLCTPSCTRLPLTESEFACLADWPCPLRYAVYRAGGAEPSLRPALWMHLLDVYPSGASHKEREEFLNRKAEEYYGLRHGWQRLVQAGTMPAILRDVTNLVQKDVRRTDRLLDLDERALYNVLTTYAVHHPSVGYCQGMSDLLSPLLHVMKTEARAYVALCGLMLRMRDNFRRDGRSIRVKFRHLRRALRTHDPRLYEHLAGAGALDLLFCYRWLLLDLKREFPYHEMLRLMEVMWSTMRPLDLEKGVELYELRLSTASIYESMKEEEEVDPRHPLPFTEDPFSANPPPPTERRTVAATSVSLKRWAMLSRRQSIAQNIESYDESSCTDNEDEDRSVFRYRRKRRRRSRSWSGRDSTEHIHEQSTHYNNYSRTVHEIQIGRWLEESADCAAGRRRHGSSDSNYGSNFSDEEEEPSEDEAPPSRGRSEGYTSGHEDSHQTLTDHCSDSGSDEGNGHYLNSLDSAETCFNSDSGSDKSPLSLLLPPPTRLGDGKPFLLFLCLTIILNHRDVILERKMDAGEIGIHFDHLVRKHRLAEVLPRARELFAEYLRTGWTDDD